MKRHITKIAAALLAITVCAAFCGCDEIFYQTPTVTVKSTVDETVEMPKLIGKTLDEANDLAATFSVNAIEKYSSDYPAGQIFEQSVAAGEKVVPGAIVDVYVSKGSNLVTVPDVTAYPYLMAKNVLESNGFTVKVVYEGTEGSCDDSVNSVSPEAGAEAEYGSEITLRANALKPSEIKSTTTEAIARDGTRPSTSKLTY